MQRNWKLYFAFIGLFISVMFIHEYIHALTAMTFGYPSWIVWGWGKFIASYSFETLPPLWIRLLIRYSPELVFLPLAAVLTWKFRNDWALMLAIPFLLISVLGFLGHAGYIG
jgi:hypothetical protein